MQEAGLGSTLIQKATDMQDAGGWAVGEAAEGDRAGEQVDGVGGEYVCDLRYLTGWLTELCMRW